ncbi:PRC-barrel domain-containing protein [Paracoccus sp. MBLB3053]|uniref:PRC-barrel domain-containing protein n=1 Tax=Paracoccus aurantius TaxID=3073814 RepID=A0ABU2HUY2_9RHOB|nr:PRC-barrel domain-containing protein [Paracoccus sp. MBLB3053]MDS9468863.1 PRC-barrel domain-containing protein [Paracoccus sp. MBLB3053]
MNKLITSTALIAALAGPAIAQTTPVTEPATTEAPAATDMATTGEPVATAETTQPATVDAGFGYSAMPGDLSAETFIGKRLYVSDVEVDVDADLVEVDKDWDDIGEISDLVIDKDGSVKAVLVDIGGFLGMGEKTVAVGMDALRVIRDGDSENDYFIVFTADQGALENAPEFEFAPAAADS